MSGFILFALVTLVFVILYQIAKASELAAVLQGEAKAQARTNRTIAWAMLGTFVVGMWGVWYCHDLLKNKLLPVSASVVGEEYDFMFNTTLIVTGIAFLITQALLFWFAFRYQSSDKRTAFYFPHNNKLELFWTVIPAIVMAILVGIGLKNWFAMTSEAPANADVVEIMGKQFNWIIRYPGKDGELGKRDFRKTNDANNVLGLDTTASATGKDDIVLQNGELHIQVGRPVKLIIGSRDVIHDVGLPHFRLKMDAVPGITTTLWFQPKYTTEQMKEITGNPNFVYEISCDQMCGKGHYSMRGTVVVHTKEEYQAWLAKQQPYFAAAPAAPAAGGAAPAAGGTAPAGDSAATATTPAPTAAVSKGQAKSISMR